MKKTEQAEYIWRRFTTILFLIMSGLSVLYYFVWTDSYATFGKGQNELLKVSGAPSGKILPCGIPVGIYLETEGILVTEVSEVQDAAGCKVIPGSGLIEVGDYIISANQKRIMSKKQFQTMVSESAGKPISLEVIRGKEKRWISVQPVLTQDGCYRTGLWVRDNMHGIGTITWVDERGRFAALGHCISDPDTGDRMVIREGRLYPVQIYSLIRGNKKEPGSLNGGIDYQNGFCLGSIKYNREQGITGYGSEALKEIICEQLSGDIDTASFEQLWEQYAVEPAKASDILDGPAQLLSCYNGKYELYEILIRKVKRDGEENRNINLEITVKDEKLLQKTGGILQGMSGSPIIQKGKLVGAVTHVLVDDPTKGYGIFIEEMLGK